MQTLACAFYVEYYKKVFPVICLFLIVCTGFAQEDFPGYDELTVEMSVPDLGTIEIPIAIKGQEAYISVKELFDYLKIKNVESDNGIEGFIINPDSVYQINPSENKIFYRNEEFSFSDEQYIQTPLNLYLKSDLFGELFGLNTSFSFRSLSVSMKTEKDLPVIKEMRLKKIRENVNRVKGVITPDTTMARRYPFFKGGTLDWGVVTTQQSEFENDKRLTLGLGTIFLGGETNLMLNYSSRVPFDSRNQFYQWRYVNNKSRLFKQITVGRIFTRATSSLFAPVSGVQVSNSPFQNRRSFGSYVLNDYTEPRWTVELYVNNILVEFTQADASGFYTFEVPLMYGNTNVKLKFYGPYGEERVEERVINIPYNFVPKNELEYTLSTGIVENEDLDRYSRVNFNYGLSNSITIGGGAEYFTKLPNKEVMPFVSSSIKFASNFLFTGEYMHRVKGEGLLSYRTPGNLQVDFNYINYDKDQTAINFNYLEERKLSLSTPIRSKNFSMYSRFSVNQIIMPTTKFTTGQLLLSGAIMGIGTNLTTYGIYNDRVKKPTIYTSLSQNYRLPHKFLFSPQIQYDFSQNKFNNIILEIERPVFDKGFLNVAYENNLLRNAHIFEVGLRYAFNFAQTSVTSRLGNINNSFVQSARGSLILDDNTGYIMTNNRTAMSRAALSIIPFLDYNSNGKRDPLEPAIPGMEIKNTSGRLSYNDDKTVLRITELQPYIDILLEINPNSLDNIAWRVKNEKIKVHTIPNQFQEIEVPIEVLGEVAGMVYLKKENNLSGLGRITVHILDKNRNLIKAILTEGDGYFTFLGLEPGNYIAEIDPVQMQKLGYTESESIEFEIKVDKYGDIVDTLEFVMEEN